MGKGAKAPTGYQPAYQSQADQGYQNLVNNSMPWATQLPGSTIPGMTTAANNIAANPYNTGAQQGANLVSSMALGAAPGTMGYYSAMNPPTPALPTSGGPGLPTGGAPPVPMGAQNDTGGMGKVSGFDPSLMTETRGRNDPAMPTPTPTPGQAAYGAATYNTTSPVNYTPPPPPAAAPGGQPAQSGIVPNMYNASGTMYGLGNMASSYAPGAADGSQYAKPTMDAQTMAGLSAYQRGAAISNGEMSMLPGAMQGMDEAMPFYQGGMQHAGQMWDQTQAAIPGLTGGMPEAQKLLANGFDPQGALYDRNYQQMMDQQNAINSMYGVAGSPYGAGVAGTASRNFNLDWGDRQLSRQIAALGAYGTQQGQVASNLTGLLNTGANGYNTLSQGAVNGFNDLANGAVNRTTALGSGASTAMNQGVDNLRQGIDSGVNSYNSMMNGSVNRFGSMVQTAGSAYGQGSGQGVDALNTANTATQLPAQTYNQQQLQAMQAYLALAQGTGAALAPASSLTADQGRYLGIGQGATQLAQNAVQINNAASAAQAAGIGQALGTIAGIALAPATGGMSLFAAASLGGAAGGAAGKAIGS